MRSFYWVFRAWLDRYPPNEFMRLGVAEKTIYSWSTSPTSKWHRANPLDKAFEITEILFEYAPDILEAYLVDICGRYGYKIEKNQVTEKISISQLHKELTDSIQVILESYEDGKLEKEEIFKILSEIQEAIYTLQNKYAEYKNIFEKLYKEV
jgi:hypothetical protein